MSVCDHEWVNISTLRQKMWKCIKCRGTTDQDPESVEDPSIIPPQSFERSLDKRAVDQEEIRRFVVGVIVAIILVSFFAYIAAVLLAPLAWPPSSAP